MPSRKELQCVANCLISKFSSRNNDYLGYWAIGQLCKIAEEYCTRRLCLNVLPFSPNYESEAFIGIVSNCAGYLKSQMQVLGLPDQWLVSAIITVEFTEDHPKNYLYWGRIQQQYKCQVELISDLGRVYTSANGWYCVPHNPQKESRRNGF